VRKRLLFLDFRRVAEIGFDPHASDKLKATPTPPPMFAATTIADEILDLKKQRKAILLAHHYQEPEIQELADVVGDSLEPARRARDFAEARTMEAVRAGPALRGVPARKGGRGSYWSIS